MSKLRIMILCSDGAHHKYLISLMNKYFNIASIIVEPYLSQEKRLLKNKKYKNYFYCRYHNLRRNILGLNKYRRRYFKIDKLEITSSKTQTITVDDINDSSVIEVANEVKPDLTIVMGTSIIHKELLNVLGDKVINIHGGFLPYYRGNHCFFFALYNKELDKIGTTIHFVNHGIDTGDIIERVVPDIYISDNAEKIYCRAEKKALHRLVELIKDYENGIDFPRISQGLGGKLYYTRDRKLYHDLIFFICRRSILKQYKFGR